MKAYKQLLLTLILLGGCAPTSPIYDHGRSSPDCAVDGSSSPISKEQALSIAKAIVTKRENWTEVQRDPDGNYHVIDYTTQRINNGGYRVEAHRAITPANGGYALWDSAHMKSVFLIINKKGIVTDYNYAGL